MQHFWQGNASTTMSSCSILIMLHPHHAPSSSCPILIRVAGVPILIYAKSSRRHPSSKPRAQRAHLDKAAPAAKQASSRPLTQAASEQSINQSIKDFLVVVLAEAHSNLSHKVYHTKSFFFSSSLPLIPLPSSSSPRPLFPSLPLPLSSSSPLPLFLFPSSPLFLFLSQACDEAESKASEKHSMARRSL